MPKQHFIFLLKGEVVTPQSLGDPDAGAIIRAVLLQGFYLSRIHIMAVDGREALRKFQRMTEFYAEETKAEVILSS